MYRKDSPASIQTMFNRIANRYDLTNAVLSFSLHRYWNSALVKKVCSKEKPSVLLDLCSGTGDIAYQHLSKASSPCHAYCVDFSSEMLEIAQQKAKKLPSSPLHKISFIESDVQCLPLSDQLADCATMAYGMRNVHEPIKCIRETLRVLKPGGCFGILELTRPHNRLLRFGHNLYLRTLIPLLGKWLTASPEAYQYLCQSIQAFLSPEELEVLLKSNGFVQTRCIPLTGGIATIILGFKPVSDA